VFSALFCRIPAFAGMTQAVIRWEKSVIPAEAGIHKVEALIRELSQ
jgi:hypothetical protein